MSEGPQNRNEMRSAPLARAGMKGAALTPSAAAPGGALALARPEEHEVRRVSSVPNLWRMAHSALRGRYAVMTLAGVVAASLVSFLGSVMCCESAPSSSSAAEASDSPVLPSLKAS